MSFAGDFRELLDDVAECFEQQQYSEFEIAVIELRRRRDVGHGEWCMCQSRPGPSCRELRLELGWKMVQRIFTKETT